MKKIKIECNGQSFPATNDDEMVESFDKYWKSGKGKKITFRAAYPPDMRLDKAACLDVLEFMCDVDQGKWSKEILQKMELLFLEVLKTLTIFTKNSSHFEG